MQLFYAPEINVTPQLPIDEAKHCIRILRHKTGDIINVTDGKGFFYTGEIISTNNCSLKILSRTKDSSLRNYHLHLAIAPTKNGERTDWLIEKCVEFGIDEITFLDCAHNERNKINMERCERIAVSAMKQSVKATLPKLNALIGFRDFIKRWMVDKEQNYTKLIAHCEASIPRIDLNKLIQPKPNILCCVGPEGDFSKQEILLANEHEFQGIGLGESRLRTETAAIAVCSYFYFK
jgi:16S rRNA (uracil1498-N3)-methyltransferase